jgi:lipopolysaccharide export system protein LptA
LILHILALLLSIPENTFAQDGDAVEITPPVKQALSETEAVPDVVPESTGLGSSPDLTSGNALPGPGRKGANAAEGGGTRNPVDSSQSSDQASNNRARSGSGTTSSSASVIGQPQANLAGNAAERDRSGPATRSRAVNSADARSDAASDGRDPGLPADLESDRSLFVDPIDQLPSFAQEQPGSISSGPEGLLMRSPPVDGFSTLLGPSELPQGSVSDSINQRIGVPGYELKTNFGRLLVPNGTITGSTRTKQFKIEGGLVVYYDQVRITADSGLIDEQAEIAVLSGNVSISDPKYTLVTDELRIRFGEKQFQATGFVQFKKLADSSKSEPRLDLPKKDRLREYFSGQQFELYCMNLHYNWDNKQLVAIDAVRLVHPSFAGTMDRLDYDDRSKTYAINGSVVLELDKYDWIFSNRLANEADEAKARALTTQPTSITCDRLLYSDESGLAQFFSQPGSKVVFDQTERKIEAAYIEVNDKSKDFHVEGSVGQPLLYNQTDGEWLFAAGIINRQETSSELADTLAQPLDASAQRMTYNFDRRRLELSGDVLLRSATRKLQAQSIIQDETSKFFLMQGNVLIEPDDKSKIYAAQVYLDTENDVVSFVGLVQGNFFNEDLAAPASAADESGSPGVDYSGLFGTGPGGLPQSSGGNQLLPGGSPGANAAEGR